MEPPPPPPPPHPSAPRSSDGRARRTSLKGPGSKRRPGATLTDKLPDLKREGKTDKGRVARFKAGRSKDAKGTGSRDKIDGRQESRTSGPFEGEAHAKGRPGRSRRPLRVSAGPGRRPGRPPSSVGISGVRNRCGAGRRPSPAGRGPASGLRSTSARTPAGSLALPVRGPPRAPTRPPSASSGGRGVGSHGRRPRPDDRPVPRSDSSAPPSTTIATRLRQ